MQRFIYNALKMEYDIKPLFTKWDVFNNFKTIKGLFQQVKVDAGGYGKQRSRQHGKEIATRNKVHGIAGTET